MTGSDLIAISDPTPQLSLEGSGRGSYTGERLMRDEPRCLRIASDWIAGLSLRAIAERHGVARESVVNVIGLAAQRGWIRPLAESATLLAGVNAVEAGRLLNDRLADIASGNLSHEVRDAAFKLAAISGGQTDSHRVGMGQPTSISQRKGEDAGADVRAYLESLKRVSSPSVVTVSSDYPAIAGVSSQSSAVVSVGAAVSSQPEPGADRRQEGGGGGAATGGRCDERCVTEQSAEG